MKKLRFVLSLITDQSDYQRQQASGAQETAIHLGVDLQTLFANNDAIEQSQQLLAVIQNRENSMNGILVEPASRTAFPKVAQAAVQAGIAWVVLNSEADFLAELRMSSSVPVFAVSPDNNEIGRIQGQQLAALMPQGGSVLYIKGPSLSTVTEQRTIGVYETKPENISMKVLKSAGWTEDAGLAAVSSWLRLTTSQSEHLDVVQAQNDLLAVGACRAMEEQLPGHQNRPNLRFLGVDGLERTGQAWVRQGLLTATIIVPPTTASALAALVSALQSGIEPAERTLVHSEPFPSLEALRGNPTNSRAMQRSGADPARTRHE